MDIERLENNLISKHVVHTAQVRAVTNAMKHLANTLEMHGWSYNAAKQQYSFQVLQIYLGSRLRPLDFFASALIHEKLLPSSKSFQFSVLPLECLKAVRHGKKFLNSSWYGTSLSFTSCPCTYRLCCLFFFSAYI